MITNIVVIVLAIAVICLDIKIRRIVKIANTNADVNNRNAERWDEKFDKINAQITAITTYLNAHFEEKKEIVSEEVFDWKSTGLWGYPIQTYNKDTIKTTTILVKNKK